MIPPLGRAHCARAAQFLGVLHVCCCAHPLTAGARILRLTGLVGLGPSARAIAALLPCRRRHVVMLALVRTPGCGYARQLRNWCRQYAGTALSHGRLGLSDIADIRPGLPWTSVNTMRAALVGFTAVEQRCPCEAPYKMRYFQQSSCRAKHAICAVGLRHRLTKLAGAPSTVQPSPPAQPTICASVWACVPNPIATILFRNCALHCAEASIEGLRVARHHLMRLHGCVFAAAYLSGQ